MPMITMEPPMEVDDTLTAMLQAPPLAPGVEILMAPVPVNGFVPALFINIKYPEETIYEGEEVIARFADGRFLAKDAHVAEVIRKYVPSAYEETYGAPLLRDRKGGFATTNFLAFEDYMNRQTE